MKNLIILGAMITLLGACSYEDESSLDGTETSIQAQESMKNRKARLKQPSIFNLEECSTFASPGEPQPCPTPTPIEP